MDPVTFYSVMQMIGSLESNDAVSSANLGFPLAFTSYISCASVNVPFKLYFNIEDLMRSIGKVENRPN